MSARAQPFPGAGPVSGAVRGEAELVEAARRGDVAAFGALYERHMPAVYRYLRLRVGDAHLAEDLTQDVFVGAFRAIGRFRWRGALRPWLVGCAHNRLANHARDAARRPGSPLPLLPATGDPPSAAASRELDAVEARVDLARAAAALRALSEAQREVVALRFGAELSVAETAALIGRSESAVKQLQAAALATFRRRLELEKEGSPR